MKTLIPHIDDAYLWLCQRRKHYPSDADIWHLRYHWKTERPRIIQALLAGEYYFEPLSIVHKADGETIHLWAARDALVLKVMAMALVGQPFKGGSN